MEAKVFQNYHKHSMYSNIRVPDSVERIENYAKRASELGHGIISSVEHGWQGRYIEAYKASKQYNLKFVFGAEVYWVKDRLAEIDGKRDKTNCHMILLAKNENGRRAINRILSTASIDGFYYQPRIDVPLLLSLPKDDVWVTTACVAGWKYGKESIDIYKQLHDHFGDNFFLEVQYHNTETQIALNKKISMIAKALNIKLIMGCDSHYINASTAWERDAFLVSKGIIYEDEQGWFMDYPDWDTAYKRFQLQNSLTDEEILEAMDNTNILLNVEEYECGCFDYEIKMPTIYPELSQREKDIKFATLVAEKWNEEKHKVPQEQWDEYLAQIKKEVSDIIITKHADYFLLDYELVKLGIAKGGIITPSGRGSGVSFYLNKLLGFTKIDRISAPVKMYPERFISSTRILESKSLADLDLNLANPAIFAEAQTELLGEGHSAPMLAYGTMKPKNAWKMYARANSVDFEMANLISSQIDQYEEDLKYHPEDEEPLNVLDYIEEKYHDIFLKSAKYLGTIADGKQHPCGYLIYQGDIPSEIGLVRLKDNVCTVLDGKWAEEHKFLKNDLLKVASIQLIYRVFERIGEPVPDVNELIKLCKQNPQVWDVYKNGYVLGVNQVEKHGTKLKAMRYAPKNISELCAFIAAIRPGFKSMYNIFESREHFDYGIPTFDKLIQTEEMPNSFVLYQEQSMATLNYAGIPMTECYDIIKAISKKRVEKIKSYKDQMLDGFTDRILHDEKIEKAQAYQLALKVWQILEDSSAYSFNASHSFSMAVDSLYGAYLKTMYPLEFYEVFLNLLMERGEKDRATATKLEALEGFGINIEQFRFRQDNRQFTAIPEKNALTDSLKAIKGFGDRVADDLYTLKDNKYKNFIELLIDLQSTSVNETQIESLITLKYFEEFGRNKKLLGIFEYFKKLYGRKQIPIEKVAEYGLTYDILAQFSGKQTEKLFKDIDIDGILKWLSDSLPNEPLNIKMQASKEMSILGYIKTTNDDVPDNWYFVMDMKTYNNPLKPYLTLYNLNNGQVIYSKITKESVFAEQPFKLFSVIRAIDFKEKNKLRKINDSWVTTDEKELVINQYDLLL
jgi:DNA polymerase III alpha subunit